MTTKMRILLDCSLLTVGGGIQVALAVIKNAMQHREIEWALIASHQVASQLPIGAENCFLQILKLPPLNPWVRFAYIRRFKKLECDINPNLVFTVFGPAIWHSHAPHLQGFAIVQMLYPEIDLYKDSWKKKLYNKALDLWKKISLQHADYLIVETETSRLRTHRILGYPKDKIFVIGNSYSPQFLERCQTSTAMNRADFFSVFIPSAFYPHKCLELVPYIAEHIKKISPTLNIKFILSLPEKDKGWQHIITLAKQLKVDGLLETAGSINNEKIADYYKQAAVVFLPTIMEVSSAVYPEAMMAGVPLITTDADFSRELCEDAALYFPAQDTQAAAKTILSVLENPTLRDSLKAAATRVLKKNYPSPDQKWSMQLQCMENIIVNATKN